MVRLAIEGPKDHNRHRWNAHPIRWYANQLDGTETRDELVRLSRVAEYNSGDALGAMLIAACVASVEARYPTDAGTTNLPGPVDAYYRRPYVYTTAEARRLSVVEAFLALDGYEYQSCESADWEASEACQFVNALRRALWHALPGYEDADTWEVKESTATVRLGRNPK